MWNLFFLVVIVSFFIWIGVGGFRELTRRKNEVNDVGDLQRERRVRNGGGSFSPDTVSRIEELLKSEASKRESQ